MGSYERHSEKVRSQRWLSIILYLRGLSYMLVPRIAEKGEQRMCGTFIFCLGLHRCYDDELRALVLSYTDVYKRPQ